MKSLKANKNLDYKVIGDLGDGRYIAMNQDDNKYFVIKKNNSDYDHNCKHLLNELDIL